MASRFRRCLVVMAAAAVLAAVAAGVLASPALSYRRANWQAALTGTFTYPTTGEGFGFWGWCDFAGGVTSGNDADCQIAEYMHAPAGSGWTCELSIDATNWDESVGFLFPFETFHMTGSLVVHPANLTELEKQACIGFFTSGDGTSTTFGDVDTFIPAAPGHYDFRDALAFFGAVGEFNFTVAQVGQR